VYDCKAEKYKDIKKQKGKDHVSSHTQHSWIIDQRALHHMTGNLSQRGTLGLTTRTQIRFAHLRHTHPHIFMVWYTMYAQMWMIKSYHH